MNIDSQNQVFDKGPWRVEATSDGAVGISSDDFGHDVMLTVSGDFSDGNLKRAYAQYLADILTDGCVRAHASRDLVDDEGILAALNAVKGPEKELLMRAAGEIARLRKELTEASTALSRLAAPQYSRKFSKASEPSPFAMALQSCLSATAAPVEQKKGV